MTVYLTIFERIWLEYEMSHFITFDFNDTDWQHTEKICPKIIIFVYNSLAKCVKINSN